MMNFNMLMNVHLHILSPVEQAVKLIEYDSSFDDAQKKEAKALKISCNLNMAACKLKLKDYGEVVKLTTKVGY